MMKGPSTVMLRKVNYEFILDSVDSWRFKVIWSGEMSSKVRAVLSDSANLLVNSSDRKLPEWGIAKFGQLEDTLSGAVGVWGRCSLSGVTSVVRL